MKKASKFTVYMPSQFGRMKRVKVRAFEFRFELVGGTLELFGHYTPKGARSSCRYTGSGSHVVVLEGWGHPECESEIGMASRSHLRDFDAMLAAHIGNTNARIAVDFREYGHAA